jgi:hypothetical protein
MELNIRSREDDKRMISMGLPKDPAVLVAIGKVAVRHGQLAQGLKLTIRSIRGISVEQALAETKRKSLHQLRELIEGHARDRFGEAPVLNRLQELLDKSQHATDHRNSVLHDLWATESDGRPIIRGTYPRTRYLVLPSWRPSPTIFFRS